MSRRMFSFNGTKAAAGEKLGESSDESNLFQDKQSTPTKDKMKTSNVTTSNLTPPRSRWSPKISLNSPYSSLNRSSQEDEDVNTMDNRNDLEEKVNALSFQTKELFLDQDTKSSEPIQFPATETPGSSVASSTTKDGSSSIYSYSIFRDTDEPRDQPNSNDNRVQVALTSQNDTTMMPKSKSVRLQEPMVITKEATETITFSTEKTSELHNLCENGKTLDQLMTIKTLLGRASNSSNVPSRGVPASLPSEAAKLDGQGRTLLHVFSHNKALSAATQESADIEDDNRDLNPNVLGLSHDSTFEETVLEKEVIDFLIGTLLPAYPGAMMIKDEKGCIPFQEELVNWLDTCHNRVTGGKDPHSEKRGSKFSSLSQAAGGAAGKLTQAWTTAVKTVGNHINRPVHYVPEASTNNSPSKASTSKSSRLQDIESGAVEASRDVQLPVAPSPKNKLPVTTITFPSGVKLSAHARFVFIMLSAVVDQLELYMSSDSSKIDGWKRKMSNRSDLNVCSSFDRAVKEIRSIRQLYGSINIADVVVGQVASIPDLIKTILLIENKADRQFIMSTSIVRRVLLHSNSVGGWLTIMLQHHKKKVSRRAIEYLTTVSKFSKEENFSSGQQSNKQRRVIEQQRHDELVQKVSRLDDFVPALLALGERGMEDASTTLLVHKVLDKIMTRPFALTVVFCDFLFLALLLWGFRAAVDRLIIGESLEHVLKYIYYANTGIFYFIIREIAKTVSLCMISKRSRAHFFSFWNIIDLLAILLAISSTLSMRVHFFIRGQDIEDTDALRGLLATTTGFLWLRVLSLLKAVNLQMATFVLAILQITKDILWFCAILMVLVVSFSQMFYTLIAPSTCSAGGDEDNMQCRQSEYLLKTYQVLLGDFGDFERDSFSTWFSVFLVVFYSFMVVVVLLNVLIAVASDSYEKCLLRSQNLFGRARVMLVAELVMLNSLLRRQDSQDGVIAQRPNIYTGRLWSSAPVFDGWSRGSVIFFGSCLLVILGWILGELIGYTSAEENSNIFYSLLSIIVNVTLFVLMMIFLASGAAGIDMPESSDDDTEEIPSKGFIRLWCSKMNDSCIRKVMLKLLGVSHQINENEGSDVADDWNGRVNFIQKEMNRIAEDSAVANAANAKAIESYVAQSEARIKADMEKLDETFKTLQRSVISELSGTKETNANITSAVDELKALIELAASGSYVSPVPSEVKVDHNKGPKNKNA